MPVARERGNQEGGGGDDQYRSGDGKPGGPRDAGGEGRGGEQERRRLEPRLSHAR